MKYRSWLMLIKCLQLLEKSDTELVKHKRLLKPPWHHQTPRAFICLCQEHFSLLPSLSLCPGAAPAMLLPVLLACLAACAVLGAAVVGLWLQQRHRAKPSRCAQLGEFQGL